MYKLNGKDLKEVFSVTIAKGSEDFLAFPERKESLKNDFKDRDGIYVDLLEPKFQARKFTIKCNLIVKNEIVSVAHAEFWQKYNGLFTELSTPGVLTLEISDLGKTFNVFYESQDNLEKLTQLQRNTIGVRFDLVFSETNPADNIDLVYLVDDQDRFLIA